MISDLVSDDLFSMDLSMSSVDNETEEDEDYEAASNVLKNVRCIEKLCESLLDVPIEDYHDQEIEERLKRLKERTGKKEVKVALAKSESMEGEV